MMMPPQFRLPTKGMKRPKKGNPFIGTELESRAMYYENNGYLGMNAIKRTRWTKPVFFIQSIDGEMFLINKPPFKGATVAEGLKPFFTGSKRRAVIRFDYEYNHPIEFCENTKAAIELFLCNHHPKPIVSNLIVNRAQCLAPLIDVLRRQPNIDYESFIKLADELAEQHFSALAQ